MKPYLEILYDEIQASKFQQILRYGRFELKHARYDFVPRDHDVNMLLFQSKTYRCNLLFVYPGGTVVYWASSLLGLLTCF